MLKAVVGVLKFRAFVQVVHYGVSQLVESGGHYSKRCINKRQLHLCDCFRVVWDISCALDETHFALVAIETDVTMHVMHLLGYEDIETVGIWSYSVVTQSVCPVRMFVLV